MDSVRVLKFGGTSVESPSHIKNIARYLQACVQKKEKLVVVVSAMGQATDELIRLAHEISTEPNSREMDMLLTTGERVSMSLLGMALSDLGVQAVSYTGSQCGMITDSHHQKARIKKITGGRVLQSLSENKVVILAGFQGVSEEKEITTLGRGGSDTTAVAMATFLGSNCCEIYTDVEGVFDSDPRVHAQAKKIDEIDFDQMIQMSAYGAGVLHRRSVEMAQEQNIPIYVSHYKNLGLPNSSGTWIRKIQEGFIMEESKISALTGEEKVDWIIELSDEKQAYEFWKEFGKSPSEVSFFQSHQKQIVFSTEVNREATIEKKLNEMKKSSPYFQYSKKKIGLLAIHGHRFFQDSQMIEKIEKEIHLQKIEVHRKWMGPTLFLAAVQRENFESTIASLQKSLIRRD